MEETPQSKGGERRHGSHLLKLRGGKGAQERKLVKEEEVLHMCMYTCDNIMIIISSSFSKIIVTIISRRRRRRRSGFYS